MKLSPKLPGFALLLLTFLAGSHATVQVVVAQAPDDQANQRRVYEYRMKGKVRLLFFWVGKDDVGGGWITVDRSGAVGSSRWSESVEVLFGSNPDRVPGGINRWGFGREEALWESVGPQKPALRNTVFEGFMRHSNEEDLSEVRSNENADKSGGSFLYDGIRSTVEPAQGVSQIRTFSATGDFDFRESDPVRCGYAERLKSGPPDKEKTLPNAKGLYEAPYGFLTAVRQTVRDVVRLAASGQAEQLQSRSRAYVYNAKPYQLKLKKVRFEDDFELEGGKESPPGQERSWRFSRVARAEFQTRNVSSGDEHDFTIWFPLEGPYQGIPLRIVDKPRWWLRVELNLEPGDHSTAATDRRTDCGEKPVAGSLK